MLRDDRLDPISLEPLPPIGATCMAYGARATVVAYTDDDRAVIRLARGTLHTVLLASLEWG